MNRVHPEKLMLAISQNSSSTPQPNHHIHINESLRRIISGILVASFYMLTFPIQKAYAEDTDTLQQSSAADRTEAKQFKFGQYSGRPRIGLALGGGGARGAAHVGVLKVLEKEGIKFDCVVGTSIGSVVGGFFCLGAKASEMEEPFLKGKVMNHFMTVPLSLRIALAPVLFTPRLFGAKPYDGLYGGGVFRNYLMGGMTCKDQKIEDLPIKFAAVTFNLVDGKPYLVKKGSLAQAMQASCAVPSLRKPVEIAGNLLADGGVICNLPVKQCRELGADFVIAVNIDQPFKKLPLEHFRKPGSVTQRMITWGLFDIDDPQSQLADVVIHPDTDGISLISTKRKDARRALAAGEKAAEEILPELRAKLQKLKTVMPESADKN